MTKQEIEHLTKLYEMLKAKDIEGVGEMISSRQSGNAKKNAKTMWERLNDTDKEFVLCDLIIGFPYEMLDLLNDKDDEKLLEWAIKRQAEITFEKMKLDRINEREKRQQTEELTEEAKIIKANETIAKGNKQWKN